MKKFVIGLCSFVLLFTMPMQIFANDELSDGNEQQLSSDKENDISHTIRVTWLIDPNGNCPTYPPFEGTSAMGSTSFVANEGEEVDISNYMYNPPGGSYWQQGFINYNGQPCYLSFTYGAGGNGINPNTGEPIDGLPFDFDPFNTLVIPGTDVDLYYIYTPYYEYIEPQENDLDKIVIYVNRPTGDINPVKQQYQVYEIFHVGKMDSVIEDVTNDYTVGQEIMPTATGFNYWIYADDPWFDIIQNSPYFVVEATTDENYYNVYLNSNYPNTETTAIEIAHYLEDHIPNGVEPKIVTADTPSYDNDPGYYLIISDLNSNLILGTTNIAITEKAQYPKISKEVDDFNVEIGQIVTFTVSTFFPRGSKAETIITDTMTEGLTYIDNSFDISINDYSLEMLTEQNGWKCTIPSEVIKNLFKEDSGTIDITYQALVNEKAVIGVSAINKNTARLDFSHFSNQASVSLFLKDVTLLKYNLNDETKTPLPGAQFELLDAEGNIIQLVTIEDGKTYRLATPNDTDTIDNFTTGVSEITINGLASDETYYFREIAAPSGYISLSTDVLIESDYIQIGNSSGGVLPSTGGIGTTFFYIIGIILIVASIGLIILKNQTKI